MKGLGDGGITATGNGHRTVNKEGSITGGTVGDSLADKLLLPGYTQLLAVRAAGENYGSWHWFRNNVILEQYEIETTTGNVKRFAQSRFPSLYEQASRPGR